MGAEADKLKGQEGDTGANRHLVIDGPERSDMLIIRLAVDEHEVWPDVAIAITFPFAGESMVVKALWQGQVGGQQGQSFTKQVVELRSERPGPKAFVIRLKRPERLIVRIGIEVGKKLLNGREGLRLAAPGRLDRLDGLGVGDDWRRPEGVCVLHRGPGEARVVMDYCFRQEAEELGKGEPERVKNSLGGAARAFLDVNDDGLGFGHVIWPLLAPRRMRIKLL